MLNHKKNRLIAATDKKIYFSETGSLSRESGSIELPISQFLSHEYDLRLFSAFQQSRSKILLIVPDHWFKHDFFPFKSQRDSLIKSFIERKLKTAYPNLPLAPHFFTYLFRQRAMAGPGVRIFHLVEPHAYDLYEALCQTNLRPRWITTAALLWEEHCKLRVSGFETQAALLIHQQAHEASLYFYFHGDFLFSRTVALPESAERLDALIFEVNQSIYLFSQKAKSDLNQVYLIGDEAPVQQQLSDFLGRPIQTIDSVPPLRASPRDLAHLDRLLDSEGVSTPSDAYSVTHSQIQQEVKWRPVQWAGTLIAALLLLFFAGEYEWLDGRLQDETIARSQLQRQQPIALADYDAALVELSEDARRPSAVQTMLKLMASLPEDVWINEIRMDLDGLRLDAGATITADTVDRFRHRLKLLVENMNLRLRLDPPIRIEDMIFNLEDMKSQTTKTHYKIAWKVNLP
jgi:hypothetical protein